MREIKFRVYSQSIQVMFDPDKAKSFGGNLYNVPMMSDGLLVGDADDIYMQFTGLQDKNGKDIYEGDILSNEINCSGAVYYVNGMFLVRMVYTEHILFKDNDVAIFRLISVNSVTKIIGNIYESPELLNQ